MDTSIVEGTPGEFSVLVGDDVVAKKKFFGGIPGERSILEKVRAKLGR